MALPYGCAVIFRLSYVVPSGIVSGIKAVHPMFRGYTQQVSHCSVRVWPCAGCLLRMSVRWVCLHWSALNNWQKRWPPPPTPCQEQEDTVLSCVVLCGTHNQTIKRHQTHRHASCTDMGRQTQVQIHTGGHTRMHTLTQTHTRMYACTHTHTHTHTHTPVAYQGKQGNETEEKVFKNRKVFKEGLKQLTGRMADRNRELVPDNWSLVRERALTTGFCRFGSLMVCVHVKRQERHTERQKYPRRDAPPEHETHRLQWKKHMIRSPHRTKTMDLAG